MEATFFFFFFEIRRRQTKFPSYEDEDNAPLVGFCWLPSVNKTPPFVSLSVSAILIKTRPPIGCTFVYFFGTSNGFPAIAIQVFPLRGLLLDDFTSCWPILPMQPEIDKFIFFIIQVTKVH